MHNVGTAHWTGWASVNSAGFSRGAIPGLDVWLRGGTWSLDGSNNVSTWTDKSGHGNNAVQAVPGSRPATTALQNGHPGARSTAPTQMDLPNVPITASSLMSIVASNSTTAGYILSWGGTTGGFISNFGGVSFEFFNPGADRKTFSAGATGVHVLTVAQVDGVSLVGWFDGVQVFSVVPTTAMSTKNLEHLFQVAGGPTACDLFEVIHTTPKPPQTYIDLLNVDLKSYYGIP